MAIPLKYATASQEIPLGYFLDSTDGNTEETGLTIANTDIKLWKAGAIIFANKNSGGATHISNGLYYTTLDATDTDTYGALIIFVHVAGALAVRVECVVMEADAYDALYAAAGTGHIEADAVQISGDGTAADNLKTACDNYSATRGLAGTALPAAAADAAGGLDLDTQIGTDIDAVLADNGEMQADLANGGRLDLLIDAIKAKTDNLPADPADDSDIDAQLATIDGIVDAIKAVTDNLPDAGALNDLATILADTNELQTDDVPGLIAALNDLSAADVNAEVDTALADIHLDHLLAADYDPASKPGTATALLNELVENDGGVSRFTVNALENAPSGSGASAETIADAVWDEAKSGHVAAGSFGEEVQAHSLSSEVAALNDLSAADVNAEVDTALADYDPPTKAEMDTGHGLLATEAKQDTIDGIVDAIKAVTDNLPDNGALSSLATAAALSTVDGIVDAIKAVTDLLPDSGALSSLATAAALTTVDTVVDAIKAVTDNLPDSGALGSDTLTWENWTKRVLAYCQGNIAKDGNAYAYKDVAGSGTVMTLTAAESARTRS